MTGASHTPQCDEGHPCQSCQLARTACTFVEAAPAPKPKSKSRDREKKNIAELEARMCALEKVLESIPPSISQAALSKLDTALTSESTLAFRKRSVEGVPKSRSGVSEAVSNDKGDTDLADKLAALSISPSYLYLDHEGNPAWAGSTSGLPLIDMLNSRSGGFGGGSASEQEECEQQNEASPQEDAGDEAVSDSETYFPGRKAQQIGLEPVLVWTQVCALIPIDLMNTLIRTYLATTHLLWPFLHIPTFLQVGVPYALYIRLTAQGLRDAQRMGRAGFRVARRLHLHHSESAHRRSARPLRPRGPLVERSPVPASL